MSSGPEERGVGSSRDALKAIKGKLSASLPPPGSKKAPDQEKIREAIADINALLGGSWIEMTDLALRHACAAISHELVSVYRNLDAVQARSTVLIEKARAWRKKIIELGGEDPGDP